LPNKQSLSVQTDTQAFENNFSFLLINTVFRARAKVAGRPALSAAVLEISESNLSNLAP
jgi:hypothetical protein